MVNTNLLRAEWVKKGLTQDQVAKELGICGKTLTDRMKKRCFRSNEIEMLISFLDIKDPMPIFFAKEVT